MCQLSYLASTEKLIFESRRWPATQSFQCIYQPVWIQLGSWLHSDVDPDPFWIREAARIRIHDIEMCFFSSNVVAFMQKNWFSATRNVCCFSRYLIHLILEQKKKFASQNKLCFLLTLFWISSPWIRIRIWMGICFTWIRIRIKSHTDPHHWFQL